VVAREPVRIAVVSASPTWRDATAALLVDGAGLEVVGTAATLDELSRLTPMPDAVVFDAPGDDLVDALVRTGPADTAFVLLADALDGDTVEHVLQLGSVAILEREPSARHLRAALQAAADGLCALSPIHVPSLMDSDGRASAALSTEWTEALTPRELQILRMLSGGLANRVIAARLEISEHTAKFHVGQILAKLGAASRTEAVTIGIRRGLIMV